MSIFKKCLSFLPVVFFLSACVSEKEFNESLHRIEEGELRIATITEQLQNVSNSIQSLESTDESVQELIKALQVKVAELEQDAETQLSQINLAIEDLKLRQTELETGIAGLREYLNGELKSAKDWAAATFSTLEQYNALAEDVAGIKADIQSIANSLSSDIQALRDETLDKISDCEEGMKKWVNEQLANYYTIAETDAKIALLEKSVKDGDDKLAGEIEGLRTQLATEKEEITEAYQKAIKDAIETNNGTLNEIILARVKELNDKIMGEISTINGKLSDILLRLDGIDATLSEILGMIQSINLIPTFSDGSVAIGNASTEVYLEIRPLAAAMKLESADLSAFSFRAVPAGQTKAPVDFLEIPLTSYKVEDGISVITVNGAGLPEEFFSGLVPFNACLSVTDGKSDIASPFVSLKPEVNGEIQRLRLAEYRQETLEGIALSADNSLVFQFVGGESVIISQHSVVPRLYLGQDDYWSVSFDNGKNIGRLMDGNGSYIEAGAFEGKSCIMVRLGEGDSGYLRYETYSSDDPDKTLDSFGAPCSRDDLNTLRALVFDDVHHLFYATLNSGHSFLFPTRRIVPASIAILSQKISLAKEFTASFEFRVNPSDAAFNFHIGSDNCEIELDRIGNATKSGSYVTIPSNYRLTRVEQVYDASGKKKTGQYRAYIQDLNMDADYDDYVSLVLSVNDGAGRDVQISSSVLEVCRSHNIMTGFRFLKENNPGLLGDVEATIDGSTITIKTPLAFDVTSLVPSFTTGGSYVYVGRDIQYSGSSRQDFSKPVTYLVGDNEYTVYVYTSHLPVVCIETPGQSAITSKEVWTENSAITIYDADGKVNYSDKKLQIRGRGNTSWVFPKKPYALKLNKKAEILGMPQHKRWVLLANWLDRTLMRTETAFQISRESGLSWTPRGQFVELVLNGKHAGNYYLCEQIKVDKNRVNISDGGFLMELDTYYDEVNKFKSAIRDLPYMFKEPDEDALQPEQFEWFQQYVNSMESELYREGWPENREYASYMDLESFADWWFVYELAKNSEPNHPKSCYMYKDPLGKLTAGPVWDFDYSFNRWQPNRFMVKDAIYYGRLFEDPAFVSIVKERWTLLKPRFEAIPDHIRSVASAIRISNDINIALWPISAGWNYDDGLPFDAAVEELIETYNSKFIWLDARISEM